MSVRLGLRSFRYRFSIQRGRGSVCDGAWFESSACCRNIAAFGSFWGTAVPSTHRRGAKAAPHLFSPDGKPAQSRDRTRRSLAPVARRDAFFARRKAPRGLSHPGWPRSHFLYLTRGTRDHARLLAIWQYRRHTAGLRRTRSSMVETARNENRCLVL